MEKIKVLHVVEIFTVGGTEEFLLNLINSIDHEKYEISVMVIFKYVDLIELKKLLKLPVKTFLLERESVDSIISFIFRGLPIMEQINKIVKCEKFDVIHTHLRSLRFTWYCALFNRIPLRMHTLHTCCDNNNYFGFNDFFGLSEWFAIKFIGFIPVAVSNYIQNIYQKKFGFKNIKMIYNGVDLEKFITNTNAQRNIDNPKGNINLICVARLDPIKNHIFLIEAFNIVYSKHKNVNLILVGDGEHRGSLMKIVENYNLNNAVHFLGARKDIPYLLSQSDIFVLVSEKEAFGLVYVEAMAAGLPVVTIDNGASPEIIKNRINGFIVDKNPSEISDAITKLIENVELRKKFGSKSVELSTLFDSRKMGKEYASLYQESISKKPKRKSYTIL